MIFHTGIAVLTFTAGAFSPSAVTANSLDLYLLERDAGFASIRTDVLLATITPEPATEVTPDYPKHKVQKDENDWTIAKKYDITVNELQAVNPNIKWTALQIGQMINLPMGAEPIGYVPSIRTSRAKIKVDNARIRSQPSTDSRIKTTVEKGTVTTVLDRKGSWYLLRFPRGTEGWVRGDLLTQLSGNSAPAATATAPSNYVPPKPVDGDLASSIVQLALGQQGIRYKWGGTSRGGFDCSGLLVYCFNKNGIKLPRTSRAMSTFGSYVSKSDLQAGDLLFYKTARSRRVNHVAMYIGDGKFIHSSSYKRGVVIQDIAAYKSPYAGARRVPGLQIVAVEVKDDTIELIAEEKQDDQTRVVLGADKIGR